MAAALLVVFGVRAWLAARRRDFAEHRRCMVRVIGLSFGITVQRLFMAVLGIIPWKLSDKSDGAMTSRAFGWASVLGFATAALVAELATRSTNADVAAAAQRKRQ